MQASTRRGEYFFVSDLYRLCRQAAKQQTIDERGKFEEEFEVSVHEINTDWELTLQQRSDTLMKEQMEKEQQWNEQKKRMEEELRF